MTTDYEHRLGYPPSQRLTPSHHKIDSDMLSAIAVITSSADEYKKLVDNLTCELSEAHGQLQEKSREYDASIAYRERLLKITDRAIEELTAGKDLLSQIANGHNRMTKAEMRATAETASRKLSAIRTELRDTREGRVTYGRAQW